MFKLKRLISKQLSNNETQHTTHNGHTNPSITTSTNHTSTSNKKSKSNTSEQAANPADNLLVKKLSTGSSKRSYDFGKFAQLYGLKNQSKDSLRKTLTSSYSTQMLANLHPSVSNTSRSSPYQDDSASLNVSFTRSFPEFIHQGNNTSATTLFFNRINNPVFLWSFYKIDNNEVSNAIQRKHSYDVKNTRDKFNEAQRRHSTNRVVNQQSVQTPIRNVIHLISEAHNQSKTGTVKESLAKALNILRSNELYNPSSYLENDIQTNALVNGLMTVNTRFCM